MEHIFRTSDIVTAISETLAGRRSKKELGDWAFEAMLRDERKVVPYDSRHWDEIHDAIGDLMYMAEGPEYELEDSELQSIIVRLERLNE